MQVAYFRWHVDRQFLREVAATWVLLNGSLLRKVKMSTNSMQLEFSHRDFLSLYCFYMQVVENTIKPSTCLQCEVEVEKNG